MIAVASAVVPWSAALATLATPAAAPVPIHGAELARARQYLYGGLAWAVASQLWMLVLLALAFYSGASRALAAWLRRRNAAPLWVVTGVTVALFGFVLIALLPFSFYISFVRESRFGFEHQTAGAWFAEWALSSLVTVAAGWMVIAITYGWLHRRERMGAETRGASGSPRTARGWWLRMWVVLAAAVVIGVAIDPLVIEPLFNRFTPITNPALRTDIAKLARRAGIPHAAILKMNASRQSAHTNAYVTGILGSQRIVLYDTLLRTETPAEIEFVVGHEIGHYVLHHLWKGVGFTVALLLGLFALLGWIYPRVARTRAWDKGESGAVAAVAPADVAGLPLVLLILLGLLFLAAPLTNRFSRWEEHQADLYGLRLTPDPCAAVSSFVREEHTDLIDPNPPGWMVFWFFNHPPQQERIDLSQRACARSRASGVAPPSASGPAAPARPDPNF